jgi:hypothetical protein
MVLNGEWIVEDGIEIFIFVWDGNYGTGARGIGEFK